MNLPSGLASWELAAGSGSSVPTPTTVVLLVKKGRTLRAGAPGSEAELEKLSKNKSCIGYGI